MINKPLTVMSYQKHGMTKELKEIGYYQMNQETKKKVSQIIRVPNNWCEYSVCELDDSYEELIEQPTLFEEEDRLIEIDTLLSELTRRERIVLETYFGLNGHYPHTLQDIAYELDLTKESVRQIKMRAINKLKENINVIDLI